MPTDTDHDSDLETWDQFCLAVRTVRTARGELTLAAAHREALQDWIATAAFELDQSGPFQPDTDRPVEPPVGFAHHHGLRSGIVALPERLAGGEHDRCDLDDPTARCRLYELILTRGTRDEIFAYLDPAILLAVWADLRLTIDVNEQWGPWIARQRLTRRPR